jgi:hypothetical protein
MVQDHSWQADNRWDGQDIPRFLRNTKIHRRIYINQHLGPILIQSNPVHTLTPYFFKIHLNITRNLLTKLSFNDLKHFLCFND